MTSIPDPSMYSYPGSSPSGVPPYDPLAQGGYQDPVAQAGYAQPGYDVGAAYPAAGAYPDPVAAAYPAAGAYPAPAVGAYPAAGAYPAPAVGAYPAAGPYATDQKSKVAAGLLGIFLGCFGAHNFYLGNSGKAVAQLLITLLSFGFLALISALWGFIEGILILSAQPGARPWGVDAYGVPLSS